MDDVMVGLVRDELQRVSDAGELASRALLRERVGIGSGDLEGVLTVLRDRGEASEVEPDGYRLVSPDDEAWTGPGAPTTEEPGVSLAEAERGAVGPATRAGMRRHHEAEGEKRVGLTAAVAKAIGNEGLGNLVMAGIEEAAEAGVPFVFEVTP